MTTHDSPTGPRDIGPGRERLRGKVALITGGARGMGASHVRTFVAEGARVVFGDLLETEGAALADELGDNCRFVAFDVTTEEGWSAAVAAATESFGGLDILINNAGILRFGSLAETTLAQYRTILEVNLVSQWLGLKYASAGMNRGGSIVNISSLNGVIGGNNLTGYSSSKFGITGLTKSAAIELGPLGIRVNSVHPGAVATPMLHRADGETTAAEGTLTKIPVPRMAHPQEISDMVLYLASDESGYCTGSQFVIDGGMSAGAGF